MAIESPIAIAFVDTQLRPMAEEVRALKAKIDAMRVTWLAVIDDYVPNNASEMLEDGREGEGVSRLSGEDIHFFMGVTQTLKTALDVAGVANIVSKPCVRPLSAAM